MNCPSYLNISSALRVGGKLNVNELDSLNKKIFAKITEKDAYETQLQTISANELKIQNYQNRIVNLCKLINSLFIPSDDITTNKLVNNVGDANNANNSSNIDSNIDNSNNSNFKNVSNDDNDNYNEYSTLLKKEQ